MSKPKLILSDIDGTILNDQAELLPATITGVRAAVRQGATMVLASARSPKGMWSIAKQLGIESTMIAYNGALTAKTDDDDHLQVFEEEPIDRKVARRVQKVIAKKWPKASINVYSNNDWFVQANGPWEKQEAAGIGYEPTVTNLSTWLAKSNAPIHKILIMADADTITEINAQLQTPTYKAIAAYRSKDTYLEIVAAGVTKATALKQLLVDDDLTPEDAIAFGDNYNDLAMLHLAGIGVAMGNAPEVIKEGADLVTTDNNHDGIYQVLNQYFD
ncbi:Cof-type HAD-IIB family hydrolase [Lactiplantibacillus mudanjiangensis]|uniref:HAD superfamily hydrolase [Lactobacillus plantarum subsp. plantarum ST-III] n=1 Tax=Lactiplantibacillus mudanjiangensis TaxID=1296538 RepID=A0A660DVZ2_9LACO|nr:Cof-type HAD-IIB family hydrolase [Lactiplantibacillus mudanjiangensis]VDG20329.1 HAD superfamily hydrolase [Lactobacillus plantarum subsp. plantarum ST-III] [Lactiplantibacillus mudanjiangensis]VDG23979.1 HAD superfamily hydrolase [Lactobacillus plantarum subsp. plantarum ST-III] [Lactiplantibacillus mudanjiangensis]VDG27203.1 HAD superfamily hydrolase [Lactobacillus plantarum subsp. plantarum ST-III] [Lactiplantibacillus mudanjiangensis]VDG33934.1 HAD superfamily hydrolase [Lactobacillus p